MDERSEQVKAPRFTVAMMVVASMILAVAGLVLTFLAITSIIGIPLVAASIYLAIAAWYKSKQPARPASPHI